MAECIVVGAGLAGAATAWHLAGRGQQVTVLERTTPGNALGSSHGSARIFRYAYSHPPYYELAVRARQAWVELERQQGQQLIRAVGCLDFGEARQPSQLADMLRGVGVTADLLSADEAGDRWPQIRFDTDVLWQPDAGVLDPEAAIEAMLSLAVATGNARILTGWEAAQLDRTSTGWVVRSTTSDAISGSHVVIAAGAWLPDMAKRGLPAGFGDAIGSLCVRQEQVYHFPYRQMTGRAAAEPGWPAFLHKSPSLYAYGLPGGRDAAFRGQKLAQFNGGRRISSAKEQDGVVSDLNRELMVDYVTERLPGLVPEPYGEATCLFTSTPTEDFIIDEQDAVILVSACSGHGAKFAPVVGEMAAEIITGTAVPPVEFRLSSRSSRVRRAGRGERAGDGVRRAAST